MTLLMVFGGLMLLMAVTGLVVTKVPEKFRSPAVLAIYAVFAMGGIHLYGSRVRAEEMAFARLHWDEPLDSYTSMTVGDLVSGRCIYFDPPDGNTRVVCGDDAKSIRARYAASCIVVKQNGLHICHYAPPKQGAPDDDACTNHDPMFGRCHE